jgi:hypothetical protein
MPVADIARAAGTKRRFDKNAHQHLSLTDGREQLDPTNERERERVTRRQHFPRGRGISQAHTAESSTHTGQFKLATSLRFSAGSFTLISPNPGRNNWQKQPHTQPPAAASAEIYMERTWRREFFGRSVGGFAHIGCCCCWSVIKMQQGGGKNKYRRVVMQSSARVR